jgi:hypothetical protein
MEKQIKDCEMLRNEFARFIVEDYYFARIKKDQTIRGRIFTLKSFKEPTEATQTCNFNLPNLNDDINTNLNVDVKISLKCYPSDFHDSFFYFDLYPNQKKTN